MATLGQQLKQSREERNISLQEIAESSHISVRFLQAIENDAYDVLPGGVFNRAFVRKFARHVGFDEEQAVNLYQEQWQEQGGEPERGYQLGVEDFEFRQTSGNGLLLSLVALIILGSLAYAAYQYFAPPISNTLGNVTSGLNTTSSPSPAHATPTPAAGSSPIGSPSPVVAASPTPSPSPIAGPMRVELSAPTEDVWVKVKTDDHEAKQMTLRPGESQILDANDKIVFISIGKAQSLKVAINGRNVDFVRLLRYPKSNVVSNIVITKDSYQAYLN